MFILIFIWIQRVLCDNYHARFRELGAVITVTDSEFGTVITMTDSEFGTIITVTDSEFGTVITDGFKVQRSNYNA